MRPFILIFFYKVNENKKVFRSDKGELADQHELFEREKPQRDTDSVFASAKILLKLTFQVGTEKIIYFIKDVSS